MSSEETFLNPVRRALTQLVGFDKTVVRAEGSELCDAAGNRYLDFSSQYGALPFGHNPPFLWETLATVRSERQPSLVQPLVSPAAERLASMLSKQVPGNGKHYTIFTNSGAESIEAAIKVCRGRTRRQVILATHNGFHGKTLGALSATGTPRYRDPFLLDTAAFEHIDYDDLEALRCRLAAADVAAFIVEPIQGEGGMIVPRDGYLTRAQELCREFGTLLVVDEVQTGLGRTGRLFASEWDGCEPDVMVLSKALGGGLVPLGACVIAEHAWCDAVGLYHSSTFANNQLTCAIGVSVLEQLLRDDCAQIRHVERTGEYLKAELESLVARFPGCFAGVSGRGLMLGLALSPWPSEDAYFMGMVTHLGYQVPLLCGFLLSEHAIVLLPTIGRNNVLRIQPSLTVSIAQIDRLIAALEEAAALIVSGRFGALISYVSGGCAADTAPPPASPARGVTVSAPRDGRHLGRFAFLMHPMDVEDIMRCMPADCASYSAQQRAKLQGWLESWRSIDPGPSALHYVDSVASLKGGYVDGWLVTSLLTPREMLRLRKAERAALLQDYLRIALQHGAQVIGLGAFTSIISRGGLDIADSRAALTTGNGLTAIMSAEALSQVARERGRPLERATVAVLGASGSVGRLSALALSARCAELLLVGNPGNPAAIRDVQAVAGEIYRHLLIHDTASWCADVRRLLCDRELGESLLDSAVALSDEQHRKLYLRIQDAFQTRLQRKPPVAVTVDLHSALPRAGAILSATSNGKSFIDPTLLACGAVICDAARPGDFGADVARVRDDIFVFEGGLVHLPQEVQFGRNNVLGHPPGVTLACLSETIALTMEGVRRHYCLGNRIPYAEALRVHEMATAHGFRCRLPENLRASQARPSDNFESGQVRLQAGAATVGY